MTYELFVGLTTSKVENIKRLFKSFQNNDIAQLPIIKGLTFIVYINGVDPSKFYGLEKTFADFNCVFIANEDKKLSIAQTREIVHHHLFKNANKLEPTVSWILDDDMEIDYRAAFYLNKLPQFFENNIDVIISPCDGEPANCFYSGLRCQLFDIVENYKWLRTLPPDMVLPNRSKDNIQLRELYPEYYYDLTQLHREHLEIPYWLEPNSKTETVNQAFSRLLNDANKLLHGRTLFRKLKYQVYENPLKHAKPSINRGGNAFVLNPRALLTPNISISLENRIVRRSDMIWSLINKSLHQMKIVSTHFPVLHLGSEQQQLSQHKMVDELIGSCFVHALKEIVGDKHSWHFKDNEKIKLKKVFIDKLRHRNAFFSEHVTNINKTLQEMQSYPELQVFATKCHTLFYKRMNDINLKVNQFASTDVNLDSFFHDIKKRLTDYV